MSKHKKKVTESGKADITKIMPLDDSAKLEEDILSEHEQHIGPEGALEDKGEAQTSDPRLKLLTLENEIIDLEKVQDVNTADTIK